MKFHRELCLGRLTVNRIKGGLIITVEEFENSLGKNARSASISLPVRDAHELRDWLNCKNEEQLRAYNQAIKQDRGL